MSKFCELVKREAKRLYNMFPEKPMTSAKKKEYAKSKKCHICLKPFSAKDHKVRNHCHYMGKYRAPAHRICNLSSKIPSYIPVIFHNLSGYDAHLFIKDLGKETNELGVIAKSREDYITFSVDITIDKNMHKDGTEKSMIIQPRFVDSFKFLSSSLETLTNNLVGTSKNRCDSCNEIRELTHIDEDYFTHGKCKDCHVDYGKRKLNKELIFKNFLNLRLGHMDKQFRLLLSKGVYLYEYMTSWEKFDKTNLPPKEAFYSNLNESGINDHEYSRAHRVWKEFSICNLGEYQDLYLKTDVLLLCNMSESFRNKCLFTYQLDLAHFYTSPGLAWQVALKKMGVKLELITNREMLLMFERRIRGGITQAVRRYARVNNKYMGGKFNRKELISFLQYLDANNLYGWAMSQLLPTRRFRWVDVNPNDINKLIKRKNKGYLLEVDVKYPKELHDLHKNLPFMCEKMEINCVKKLIPNLYNRKNYIIHIEALNQALKHGLILKKIHQVIEFSQSAWLKPYIDLNTELRAEVKNDFEKDFFKLMNNAVFGKTMENIQKHRNIKLVTNERSYLQAVMKPNFKSGILFSENLMGCKMGKVKVVMNKPVYLGQAILDLSKTVMYEFHYDYMLPKYGDNLKLCYMDTDSFIYDIRTEDFYADIADDVIDRFDTSSYDKDDARPLPIGKNKKVIGMMKGELGGKIITEFVALRPKSYAYKYNSKEEKKCEGIKKCVVKKTLGFDDYVNCLLSGTNDYRL